MIPTPLSSELKEVWRQLRSGSPPRSPPIEHEDPEDGVGSNPEDCVGTNSEESPQKKEISPNYLEDLSDETLFLWENLRKHTSSSLSIPEDHASVSHQNLSLPPLPPVEQSREDWPPKKLDDGDTSTDDGNASSAGTVHAIVGFNGYASLRQNEGGSDDESELKTPRATLRQAVGATLRSLVGTGVLFLPHGMSMAGLAGSAPAFMIACGLVVVGCTRLIQSWSWFVEEEAVRRGLPSSSPISFPQLTQLLIGSTWARILECSIIGIQIGACVSYLAFVSESAHEVFKLFDFKVGKGKIMLVMMLIEMPICCLRDLSFLDRYNFMANLIIVFCIIVIIGFCAVKLSNEGIAPGVNPGCNSHSAVMFLGTLTYSFEGAAVVIPIANSLAPSDRAQFSKIYFWTLLSISLVYAGYSTLAYLTFGSEVEVILTMSLGESAFPAGVVRFLWAIAVVFTYPLQLFPVSELLHNFLFGSNNAEDTTEPVSASHAIAQKAKSNIDPPGQDSPSRRSSIPQANWKQRIAGVSLRVGLVVVTWLLAVIGSSSLDHIVALVGGLCGAPMALVIPSLMHNAVLTRKEAATIADLAEVKRKPKGKSREDDLIYKMALLAELQGMRYGRCLNIVIVVAGGAVTILTTTMALATWGEAE